MSIDWSTFKSKLNLGEVSVSYINEEGAEISIDSEPEFQEALRLAKLNKNHLQLILTVDESSDFAKVNEHKIEKTISNISVFTDEKKKLKYDLPDPKTKENVCHCKNGIPPEWFTHYMKKFKKELLHELKMSVNESVRSALRKERKILEVNPKINDVSCDSKVVNKEKKKKKCDDHLEHTLLDHRELKALKKCLRPSKVGRLESKLGKLEIKTKSGGKFDLFEKKTKEKKLEKAVDFVHEKSQTSKKSCVISTLGRIQVRPGSNFLLHLFVENNGEIPWSCPQLVFDLSEEFLIDAPERINLRKLQPRKKWFFGAELKAGESTGLFKLPCTVMDGDEILGQPVDVWVEITPEAITEWKAKESKNEDNELINFNHDVIAKSQKKIEKNILEIEKRLQHIDLLRSSTILEDKKFDTNENETKENKSESWKNVNNQTLFETGEAGRFFNQNQTNFDFGNSQDTYVITTQDSPHTSKNKEDRYDSERNSDSEISIVYASDENFIFVPSTNDEDFAFTKKKESVSGTEDVNQNTETNVPPKKSFTDRVDDLIQLDSCEEEAKSEKSFAKENVRNQFTSSNSSSSCSSSRSRRSRFGECSSEFKSKKMKSNKSSEYRFTKENLKQSQFFKHPKKEKEEGKNFTFKFAAESKKKSEKKEIRTVDSVGRVIYAIDVKGYCLPVASLLEEQENSTNEPLKYTDLLTTVTSLISNSILMPRRN